MNIQKYISVRGARENNLKNINIDIPRGELVVMTGLSGSGKSTLAFDTIYAEGQRRYLESLSAYVRQFLGNMEKPDVDSIEGLSPAVSIDQKTTSNNPRSTVGTVTEIYDYLRLMFARVGKPICPNHNIEISAQTVDQILDKVLALENGSKIVVLAPIVSGQKGMHQQVLANLKKDGYVRARINGDILDLDGEIKLDKNKKHSVDVVIDRIVIKDGINSRLYGSLETALELSGGKVLIDVIGGEELVFSEHYACPYCDFSVPKLEPRMFSFNSPFGACPSCNGLGVLKKIDPDLLIKEDTKPLDSGEVIRGFDNKDSYYFQMLEGACEYYNIDMTKPFKDLSEKDKRIVFYGSDEEIPIKWRMKNGKVWETNKAFEGVMGNLERRYKETTSSMMRDYIESLMSDNPCPVCNGARLSPLALSVKIDGENIDDFTRKSVENALKFVRNLNLNDTDKKIADMVLKEVDERLSFLEDVGLSYLTLNRQAGSLSGGEAQRIRLATQIGSRLTGVLYVLDEPSIGLHQRDNDKLIKTLKSMRDLGNTLLVVEHDEETMQECDYIIDIGPNAGVHGGEIVFAGTPKEILKCDKSLTGKYLAGKEKIEIPTKRREFTDKYIEIIGAKENNLKNIDVKIPLGLFVAVSGVSGSGKSSLVNEILYKALAAKTRKNGRYKIGKHTSINNLEEIERVIQIDQSPIGRTPRSNPATYTGVFDHIRDIFASTKEAKMRGYLKGRFSFNVRGGRCEACNGDGVRKIEMHFLPDVYVPCEVCKGKRYNSETLEIKYNGKNIYDILDMTIEDGYEFFKNIPKIEQKLKTMLDVGMGYIKLGQSATTLSGGEAQRVKLASELHKKITSKTIFILDEPTTGLHIHDVKKLIAVLERMVASGGTVVVIEHNLDMLKVADYIIDIGPEGGDKGGTIVAAGSPEDVADVEGSYTGHYLKKIFVDN